MLRVRTPRITFSPSSTQKIYVKVSGAWKQAIAWVKVSGVWKQAVAYVKVSGAWKNV
jgi:hypothetical protein